MDCPRCSGIVITRDGLMAGKRRWHCKTCNYHFTLHPRLGKSPEQKEMAVRMFIEGLGFRAIARVLDVSNVAVLNWIREGAKTDQRLNAH